MKLASLAWGFKPSVPSKIKLKEIKRFRKRNTLMILSFVLLCGQKCNSACSHALLWEILWTQITLTTCTKCVGEMDSFIFVMSRLCSLQTILIFYRKRFMTLALEILKTNGISKPFYVPTVVIVMKLMPTKFFDICCLLRLKILFLFFTLCKQK